MAQDTGWRRLIDGRLMVQPAENLIDRLQDGGGALAFSGLVWPVGKLHGKPCFEFAHIFRLPISMAQIHNLVEGFRERKQLAG